jgi:hypothetical protein
MKNLYFLAICLLLALAFVAPSTTKNCPKLVVSANGHYLSADGKPFFWLGDTGWLLLGKLNREETEKYLETRRVQGFNVIQVMLLHSLSITNSDGDSALIGRNPANPKLSVADGLKYPSNNGYWENLDFVLDLAAKKGIYLALVPIWGSNVKSGHVSNKEAEAFAKFLARRYRDRSNIIWLNGGDVRGDDSTRIWNTIGNTLKKEDPNHLVTFHPFGRTQSSEWFHNEAWLDFNMFQSGHRDYAQDTAKADHQYGEDNWRYVQVDFNKRPAKPTLDGEPSYEGIPHGLHDTLQPRWTDSDLRRYAYWSVFSGACGFTYGNNSVMQMQKRGAKTGAYGAKEPWEQAIYAPGATQMIHLKNLMRQYHFEALTPAQSIFPDPGERYNHLTALKGEHCLLVYTCNGRNITVKTDQLKGSQFRYSWYSPRDGKFLSGGKILKRETLEFDPPGTAKDGNDWVLILEKNRDF